MVKNNFLLKKIFLKALNLLILHGKLLMGITSSRWRSDIKKPSSCFSMEVGYRILQ